MARIAAFDIDTSIFFWQRKEKSAVPYLPERRIEFNPLVEDKRRFYRGFPDRSVVD